jgi:hypothetical protein
LIFLGIKFDGSEVLEYSPKLDKNVDFLCTRRHRFDGLRKMVAIAFQPFVAKLYRIKVGDLSSPIKE